VPFDRAGADEKLGADLRIRQAVAGKPRDEWSSSQARVLLLSWLERLSVITQMVPSGLACSSSWRKSW